MAFDTLILNGTIVDGTNTPRYKGDVGISNGRIEAMDRSVTPRPKSASTRPAM
ncbi:MAG: hypothetical protein O3A47_09700 [Chloroflexi bacterium]|nr:hypothetical protein [Chloroflexota bacterium]